jgi:hypothetical protein
MTSIFGDYGRLLGNVQFNGFDWFDKLTTCHFVRNGEFIEPLTVHLWNC